MAKLHRFPTPASFDEFRLRLNPSYCYNPHSGRMPSALVSFDLRDRILVRIRDALFWGTWVADNDQIETVARGREWRDDVRLPTTS